MIGVVAISISGHQADYITRQSISKYLVYGKYYSGAMEIQEMSSMGKYLWISQQ